jgi:hypothetical protein
MNNKNMTTEEFRERLKVLCGFKPSPYYNPPAVKSPLVRPRRKRGAK